MRREPEAGFTLVELLVSMAILALIAVVLTAGLRFVLHAMASTDSRREGLEELTLGLSVLRNELGRAEPMMVKQGERHLVLFSGGGDRLRFVNVEPPYLAGPPYLAYEFEVSPDQGAYRIALRRAPVDPSKPDLAAAGDAEARTLVRVNRPLDFTYWGRLDPHEAPAWHKDWPPGPHLPDAIRLAGGGDPGWPELVVRLRITAPWYCGGAPTAPAGNTTNARGQETQQGTAGLAGGTGSAQSGQSSLAKGSSASGGTEQEAHGGPDQNAGCPDTQEREGEGARPAADASDASSKPFGDASGNQTQDPFGRSGK